MHTRTIPALRSTVLALALAGLAAGLAACGSSSGGKQLTLVAYSTPEKAFARLIPAFEATGEGKGASFSQSYGPSGDQSRSVAAGLKADVVNFSLEPDVTRLVKAGLVSSDWNKNATHGFVTNSVVVIVVRKGNPKHIAGWSDLVKPGVGVVTPNPFTSGSARWNVMAAYGAQLKEGKTPAQALAYLQGLFKNVVSQDSSARNALQTFLAGRGDALLDYEDEAIADERVALSAEGRQAGPLDQSKQPAGSPIEYIVPKATILIQNPIAVLTGGNTAEAQKFVGYLLSPAGQKVWAEHGYRPVIEGVASPGQFPTPADLFTIESLGGWKQVGKQFFETEGTPGLVTKIEQSLGVSTSK
ncbi:MAG TPA: sulfate ABC transporter substrate-binding protein [Solirubrobacteraceae bacterium]|nr:sulfate ABC transporter substrate-binding protein [Solirubrobacteraceae bacterium]